MLEPPNDGGLSGRPTKRIRRPRQHISCIPCRERKIKCDRNVPNCATCVRRGVVDQCRWGDDRDGDISDSLRSYNSEPFVENVTIHAPNRTMNGRTDVVESGHRERPPSRPSPLQHPGQEFRSSPPNVDDKKSNTRLAELYSLRFSRWKQLLLCRAHLIPHRPAMSNIVSYYMQELEPLLNCVNGDILVDQFESMWNNLGVVYRNESAVDSDGDALTHSGPLAFQDFWTNMKNYGLLALALSIVYVAYDSLSLDQIHAMDLLGDCNSRDDVTQVLERIYTASEYFLHESQYEDHATLWSLQAILLQQRRHYRMGYFSTATVWHARAVRIGYMLGLSRLGSTKNDLVRFRQKDSKLGPDTGVFIQNLPMFHCFELGNMPMRELARKVWTALVAQDWFVSLQLDLCYLIPEEINNTSPPASLEDSEVEALATLPMDVICDQDRISPSVYLRFRLEVSRCSRLLSQICSKSFVQEATPIPPMEEVFKVENILNNISSKLPDYFRMDGDTERSLPMQLIHAKCPYLTVQRLFLHENIQHVTLRLHSLYFKKGLVDKTHRKSVDACIQAAKEMVQIWEVLQSTMNSNRDVPYLKWHLLIAASVFTSVVASKIAHPDMESLHGIDLGQQQEALEKAVYFLEEIRPENSLGTTGLSNTISRLSQYCRRRKGKTHSGQDKMMYPNRDTSQNPLIPDLNLLLPMNSLTESGNDVNNFWDINTLASDFSPWSSF